MIAVYMCDFDGVWRCNYFGGEPVRENEVEVRAGKLKNWQAADKEGVTGDKIKGGSDRVVDWIWRLCNMTFESGAVPED